MSDPSVRAMTELEWYFEYEALQRKQKEDFDLLEASFKGLRALLTDLLGLDLSRFTKSATTEGAATPAPFFVPASFLFSRPDALEHYRKEADREAAAEAAAADESLDEFSDSLLASLEKGVDLGLPAEPKAPATPEEAEEQRKSYWASPEAAARLAAVGVKPRLRFDEGGDG